MPVPLGLQIIQLASQRSVISGERTPYSSRFRKVMVRDLLTLLRIVTGK